MFKNTNVLIKKKSDKLYNILKLKKIKKDLDYIINNKMFIEDKKRENFYAISNYICDTYRINGYCDKATINLFKFLLNINNNQYSFFFNYTILLYLVRKNINKNLNILLKTHELKNILKFLIKRNSTKIKDIQIIYNTIKICIKFFFGEFLSKNYFYKYNKVNYVYSSKIENFIENCVKNLYKNFYFPILNTNVILFSLYKTFYLQKHSNKKLDNIYYYIKNNITTSILEDKYKFYSASYYDRHNLIYILFITRITEQTLSYCLKYHIEKIALQMYRNNFITNFLNK